MSVPSPRLFRLESKRLKGNPVPRWVVGCPECKQEFTHSEISADRRPSALDPFAWIGDKPDIPETGISLKCPNCNKAAIYKRYQLTYRST
jgi:hypothetical protein